MFSLKRNQIIISALVIMICVAGYLNYLDSRKDRGADLAAYDLTDDGEISAIVMDDITGQEVAIIGNGLPNGEIGINTEYPTGQETDPTSDTEPGTAVFVSSSTDSSFFVQAKLTREQDRSKQKDTLTGLIGSDEIDRDTKALCAEAVLDLNKRMESESAAEAALTAKGFGESYVRMDDQWVEVIIHKSLITDQELAQIEDIVTRLTGFSIDQIRLSSVKQY